MERIKVGHNIDAASDPATSTQIYSFFGGAERDRTADLLVANEALSQLSYSPYQTHITHRSRRSDAVKMTL